MHGRCNPLQQPVCQALHACMEELAVGCQPANSKIFHVSMQDLSGRLMQKLAAPMQQTTEKTLIQPMPLVLLQHHISSKQSAYGCCLMALIHHRWTVL